jgi:alginate O-acetyltransferase complex protein AlgI
VYGISPLTVPSWQFLVFALAGAAAFNISSANRWRNAVWLVLNLTFVSSFVGAIGPLLPLAGFLALGYISMEVTRIRRGWTAPISVILVLAVFIWLKRYTFIPPALLLPSGYLTIGLSYIFFRVMHLVVDTGQGAQERISVLEYMNFTLNFPAFISGPIQRLQDYQEHNSLPLGLPDIGWAAWRMVLGAFKVLILSAALHAWQLELLASFTPELATGPRLLSGALIVVIYPLFLYANFSGYTDFVIGVARLYRLRLPENFDQPFAALNFIEFWSRWHISLSQWLRSYVFNPLLMTWLRRYRSARSRQYPSLMAFFVTFFLVGAWHGQTSEFLFFGLLQGGGVAGNRLYQVTMTKLLTPAGYGRLCANAVYRTLARGLTFTWFACTLIWFWSTWSQIVGLAEGLGLAASVLALLATVSAASVVLAIPDVLGAAGGSIGKALRSRYTRTAFASAMILAITMAAVVLQLSAPEIVYRQF